MKQIIQDLSKGHTLLEDIPVPMVKKGTVLIKTHRSLVFLGTEKDKLVARTDATKLVIAYVKEHNLQN